MSDYERTAISNFILSPHIFYESKINEDMFTDYDCTIIYKAIREIIESGGKPDLISITDKNQAIDKADLARMSDVSFSSANWKYYDDKILQAWQRKELARLGTRLATSEENYTDLLEVIETTLATLVYSSGKQEVQKVSELLAPFLALLNDRFNNKGILPGLSTGIDGLDGLIQGLKPRLLYVIGGRPSQGKSALGLNIAAHVATKDRHPVGFLSLESSAIELTSRLMSSGASVDGMKIATGMISQANLCTIQEAGEILFNAPLYFWDQPNAKLSDVVSMARFMRRQHKVDLLVLDYVQIVQVPGADDRKSAVSQVSMAMKQLARELEIPIIILAQLNRDTDNKRPDMGNFQWSSQLEQDADVAIMLYHKLVGEDETQTIDKSFLLVEKCRDGRRGSVPVVFRQEYVRFESYLGKE